MAGLTLAALLLAQTIAAAPGTEVRTLTVSFVDEAGGAAPELGPADVALLENGVTRDITSFRRDLRPLAVAILLDSSAAVGDSFRPNLMPAVAGFVARLPDGARYALWTTGDRPTKVVELTADKGAAPAALRRVIPQGGNTMLDALVEASADLRKSAKEGERSVVVAVSSTGPELSSRDKLRAAEETLASGALVLALAVDEGGSDFETRSVLGYVFDRLRSATGGRYETVLSPMAADGALRKLSAMVAGAYRLAYATAPDLKKRKIELRVARPGTKAFVPAP
jgi:hypothetical protein